MEIYNYKMILKIDNEGIVFTNGNKVIFKECSEHWNTAHNCSGQCIGERDITAMPKYFMFYSEDKIKLEITGIMQNKKFSKIRQAIKAAGFTTYDLS